MLCNPRLGPDAKTFRDSQRQGVLTSHQAEKIVNIAGIRTGDNVLYTGAADSMIEDAVKTCGTRLIVDRLKPWPLRVRNSADVALCFLSQGGTRDTIQALRIIRHYLRPGGRLVMWTTPDNSQHTASFGDHLKVVTATAGFTSMIVGRLPGETGRKILVATGILIK